MVVQLEDLVVRLDDLLNSSVFSDYCPNGLQVEGAKSIKKIVTGVTANQALIDAAIKNQADAILVHHGFFWKGEQQVLTGIKGARIKSLMQHNISLLAYHLPLDAHPILGNNAQLAQLLGFDVTSGMGEGKFPVGNMGVWHSESGDQSGQALAAHVSAVLNREAIILGDKQKQVHKVAWCTGAAESMIEQAAQLGADCFISGEVSEQTTHLAQELGVVFMGAGHHATERYGVKALGEYVAVEFGVDVEFIDIDNPV